MLSIAVAILNYNGLDYLRRFLPGVVANSKEAQTVVIDNASTDQSVEWLRANHPEVNLVQLPINYGFCQGYNEGLKQISADVFVLLNSDVETTPGWLDAPLRILQSQPEVAAVQPKILCQSARTLFEHAGAGGGFLDALGYPFCRGRVFHHLETDTGQYNDEIPVFWASGACMFVRSSVYKQLGGLDSHFFAHMEEIDLCWRIHHAGMQVYYTGLSTVYHVGGGTLPKTNPHKTFLNFRNGLYLLYKNVPFVKFVFLLPLRLLLDGVAGAWFLLQGNPKDTWAVVRAHFAFYFSMHQLTKSPVGGHTPPVFHGSLVWESFVKGVKKFEDLRSRVW